MAKEKTETINVTPKWSNLTPLFFQWLESGVASQKQCAKDEINRMAKILDELMAHRGHGDLTCPCGETFDLG